jgi:Xaa-Pro aminopeptidase
MIRRENPHPNLAQNARLGWGTLEYDNERGTGHPNAATNLLCRRLSKREIPRCVRNDKLIGPFILRVCVLIHSLPMDYLGRQQRLIQDLAASHLDALLVTHLPNIRYLCGFTGSAGALLIGESGSTLFTDGRYREQANNEVLGARLVITRKGLLTAVGQWLRPRRSRASKSEALGIEGQYLTVAARRSLSDELPRHIRVREVPPLVERARMIKDADEIAAIRSAAEQGAELFNHALKTIRPGVKEVEVAAEMEYAARKGGAEAMAFETIVASGTRSALPHGRASSTTIVSGAFVVCDFGVILHGYCSDRTRTVYVGAATAEARRVYDAVLASQQAAIDTVRPGVKVGRIDQAARKTLQQNGLAQYFTHSTGHGVGLEIHEAPRVAQGQQEVLRPGMVITIEPGVYLPGKWGVRIEDMVVVTEKGSQVLTPTQKEFIVI